MIKANFIVMSMELADIDFDLIDLMSSCYDDNLTQDLTICILIFSQ